MSPLLAGYLIGVLIGLWRTDGPLATRLGVALLWPLGPAAFVVTITGLILVLLVARGTPRSRA